MSERILYECDSCRKTRMINELPQEWGELVYSWRIDHKAEQRYLVYHSCSISCYYIILNRCIDYSLEHCCVTIAGNTTTFIRALLADHNNLRDGVIKKVKQELITHQQYSKSINLEIKLPVTNEIKETQVKEDLLLISLDQKDIKPKSKNDWTQEEKDEIKDCLSVDDAIATYRKKFPSNKRNDNAIQQRWWKVRTSKNSIEVPKVKELIVSQFLSDDWLSVLINCHKESKDLDDIGKAHIYRSVLNRLKRGKFKELESVVGESFYKDVIKNCPEEENLCENWKVY